MFSYSKLLKIYFENSLTSSQFATIYEDDILSSFLWSFNILWCGTKRRGHHVIKLANGKALLGRHRPWGSWGGGGHQPFLNIYRICLLVSALPEKIFLMVMGLSPKGESLPPSRLKPRPVPSFFRLTVMGAPRGASTNFRSEIRNYYHTLAWSPSGQSGHCCFFVRHGLTPRSRYCGRKI